jgi:hypothetical protein
LSDARTVRERNRERSKAKTWWSSLSRVEKWAIGDDLVWGTFDWREWGFSRKPTSAFMNAVDYERTLWEQLQ